MDQDKRFYRKLKRTVKRRGTRNARRQLKRDLVERPEEAHESEIDYGRDASVNLNGMDRDATRRRQREDETE